MTITQNQQGQYELICDTFGCIFVGNYDEVDSYLTEFSKYIDYTFSEDYYINQ